ncbi:antirestriction protein [Desulfosarcina ovata]|nr:antirestriction protein [Desulfosarcina ovata]
MAPRLEQALTVESFGWQCQVMLSADAAGLCDCLFAVGELAERSDSDWPIELYHNIRDYALAHPESDGIWKVID